MGLMGIVPSKPTFGSMAKYIMGRMETLRVSRGSNVLAYFTPVLSFGTDKKRIGFRLSIDFAGMTRERSNGDGPLG
jgi:hypothetical protein